MMEKILEAIQGVLIRRQAEVGYLKSVLHLLEAVAISAENLGNGNLGKVG
jgi:hypothetical protein